MDRLNHFFFSLKPAIILYLLIVLFSYSAFAQDQKYDLWFNITDQRTGLAIENVQVSIEPCQCGGISNENGFFSIILSEDTYTVNFYFVGYAKHTEKVVLNRDRQLNIMLTEQTEQLSKVFIQAKKTSENINSPQMGVIRLDAKELKKLPSALGEFDILKGLTLLAGVNSAGDVSNGISVRGGSLDQNLLLYDHAPVFNPTHLFGVFSVFTPDILSSMDLYKANIPTKYGGRVSSVLDIKTKNPYTNTFKMSGGLGIVSSRLLVETPIIEDKLMLIAGARVGLTDFLLPIFSKRLKNTKAKFGDATIKLLYLPTDKDQVSFTGFYSKDFYQLDLISKVENINAESNQYDFATINGTLKWVHSLNEKSNFKTILVGSKYTPKIIFPELDNDNEIVYDSGINYLSLNSEFSKKVKDNFEYYVGIQANQYKIEPGALNPGNAINTQSVSLNSETSYELSGYFNADWKPTDYLSLSAGLRHNHFLFVGPFEQAIYDETGNTIVDTELFEKGEKVKSYDVLEPRLSLALKIDKNTSFKASYARVNQFVQNVYNSTTPLPTSRWKTSDSNIVPQIGNSFGLGLYRNFNNNKIEVSLESFYKDTQNILTYKPGANFFLEEFLEKDVVQGEGQAYGLELSFKKSRGKINGWFNYTWSRSLFRSTNEDLRDQINNNDWFISDFDRPHVFNGAINFEGNKYNNVSFNFTMQSGRPYTVANGFVQVDNIDVPIFLERNNARLPLYHRLDFSWNIHFSESKKNKRWKNDWTFTIYNLYGRDNPLNIFYTQQASITNGGSAFLFGNTPLGSNRISVLNSPLFSITYNFTFQ